MRRTRLTPYPPRFVLSARPTKAVRADADATASGSAPGRSWLASTLVVASSLGIAGCTPEPEPEPGIAQGVFAPLGEIMPAATEAQRETFERGRQVALHRHSPEEGLGPLVNVGACADCHERPVLGGSAPRYRDFQLMGTKVDDGSFIPAPLGGVLQSHGTWGAPPRPTPGDDVNVIAHRNAIPMFGVGLLAEIPEAEILRHEDPNDSDGDGISGRANFDRGFVGRFGRKSQTVSIEGFIRGPLNNHLGITTDPLTDEQRAELPVPSDGGQEGGGSQQDQSKPTFRQAAAPAEPLTDSDPIPDPEMSGDELFDLISFAMLLAAPQFEELSPAGERGFMTFQEIGCDGCHVQTLTGPRGKLPLYSDLLLHDMGEEMSDGIAQGLATATEFRTQPLWGVAAVGPYLHDGRADTLHDAILWHGGEASAVRDAYVALDSAAQADLGEFLMSLGGRELKSPGLLAPNAAIPGPGEPGSPSEPLNAADEQRWLRGRAAYDGDQMIASGLGPFFNGDSCRACHSQPVIGGSGPMDLDVMRIGTLDGNGEFVAPASGTIIHRVSVFDTARPEPDASQTIFEQRQTPTNLGLGAIESIPDTEILALADPSDANMDGIRGVAHVLPDGRLGRFGWKAQVPSIREFVRDALSAELGMTLPEEAGFSFGALTDSDDVTDPELSSAVIDDIEFFLARLAPPTPQADVPAGRLVFEETGCALCHVPELMGSEGPVPLYSDLLLHEILDTGDVGIVDGLASMLMFRTPPLWGLSTSGPYMHDGRSTTLDDAITRHAGEATGVVAVYEGLSSEDRDALLDFLANL